MSQIGWMGRALNSAAAIAFASLAMAGTAVADTQYLFNFSPTSAVNGTLYATAGEFTTDNSISSNGTANILAGNYNYKIGNNIYSGSLAPYQIGPALPVMSSSISNGVLSLNGQGSGVVVFQGTITAEALSPLAFTGNVELMQQDRNSSGGYSFGYGSFEIFTLSGASTGGSGSSGSGGAPSPEVNAGLGMLLAGATFVFLRRKRGGRPDEIAA